MARPAASASRLVAFLVLGWSIAVVLAIAVVLPSPPGQVIYNGCDAIYMPAEWYVSCEADLRKRAAAENAPRNEKYWREVELPFILVAAGGYALIAAGSIVNKAIRR